MKRSPPRTNGAWIWWKSRRSPGRPSSRSWIMGSSSSSRRRRRVIHLKEVKYRPGIDDHDFDFKTRHAREFLADGNKVKVTMMNRGRQMAHIELGREVLDRVAQELKDIGKIEQEPKLEGRNMSMVLAPK